MTEYEAKIQAHEKLGLEYLRGITPTEWTVTPSTDQYERFDVTVSKGDLKILIENKIREFDYENNPYGPYALVDVSKVEYLINADENARIVSYFPKNNAIFSHKVKDYYKWKKKLVDCNKNGSVKEKVPKEEYFLPTTDEYRVKTDLNISDGLKRLKEIKEKLLSHDTGEKSL